MGKNKPLTRIDVTQATSGGAQIIETVSDNAPPALPTIPTPTDLALATAVARSAVTPTALISATWEGPLTVQAQRYAVQWSTDNTFPDDETSGADAVQESATIDHLKPGTTYYVRVAAIYRNVQSPWSDTASITTATDTTPPDPITGLALDMSTGDLVITWTNPTNANFKDVQIDLYDLAGSVLRKTVYSNTGRFVWRAADNLATSGTTTKYAVQVKVRARSYSNVYSSTVSGTVTKAAPTAPAGVSISGILSTLTVSITGTKPVDVVKYKLRLNVDGFDTNFFYATSQDSVINAEDTGLYEVGVKALDAFDQESSETVSGTVSLDFLTIDKLRAGATYKDSAGTFDLSSLKDGTTASGGVTYASSTSWRWVLVERPLPDRYQNITTVATAGIGYVGISYDNVTWSWFAGPLGTDGRTLTAVANEAAAQSAAVTLPTSTGGRLDFPSLQEGRFLKLGFKMTSGGTLREFYPRRLVEADDIRAQTLAAITADLGTITAGSMTAVTITGSTVRTAASGARVELSSAANGGLIGYGSSDTYDPSAGTGSYQVLWKKADGKLYAGGGNVILSSDGIRLVSGNSSSNRLRVYDGATMIGEFFAYTPTTNIGAITYLGNDNAYMQFYRGGLVNNPMIELICGTSTIQIDSTGFNMYGNTTLNGSATVAGNLLVSPSGSGTAASIEVGQGASGNRFAYIDLRGDDTYTDYGLRILRSNGGANTSSQINHRGTGALQMVANDAGAVELWVNGNTRLKVDNTGLGFFAVTPVARQTGGSATAGNSYTTTERDMINRMYTALRNYGLLT